MISKACSLETVTSAQAEASTSLSPSTKQLFFFPEHFYSYVRRRIPICNPAAVKKATHVIISVWVCSVSSEILVSQTY